MTPTASLASNRSFLGLTAAQFLGTINDHLYKMVVSLFAIGTAADAAGSGYLSLSGVLFVTPYLLFSGYAGHVADVVSKRTVLKVGTIADVVIMVVGLVALTQAEHVAGMLLVLFLMATQATFFSPSKYGCVPEIVPAAQLTRANGILEASRYSAVILGSLTGGALMYVWRDSPAWIGAVTVSIAVAEVLCSLAIERLPSGAAVRRSWPRRPWSGVSAGLSRLRQSRSLSIAVASITFFEAVAALVVMDVLLLAKFDLGVGDAAAGALGAFAAIGAGMGALVCSRLSRPKAELGFTPIAGLGLAAALVGLASAATSYGALAIMLVILGICSGAFFVPFLAWLQKASGNDERGLVLSTNNFMNMLGVLTSSAALFLLHDLAGLSPRAILGLSAVATLGFITTILILSKRLRTHLVRRVPALGNLVPLRRATPRPAGTSVVQSRFRVPAVARQRVRHAAAIAVAVIAFVAAMSSTASAAEENRHLTYQIRHERLGDIGSLTQEIVTSAGATQVVTRIKVHASLFGVTLRHMQSEWREEWREGLLQHFAGTTVADGATESITGEASGESFTILTGDRTFEAPADVQPVNPWSLQFTRASTFMSPESGRLTEAAIVPEGLVSVKVNGHVVQLHRYRASFDGEHELYFDDAGTLVQFAYSELGGKIVITLKPEPARLAMAP